MKRTLVLAILLVMTACHTSPKSALFSPYHVPSGASVDAAGSGDGGDGSSD
jgi:hypothetical protein